MTARPARAVALIILDGWGYREATEANAIRLARTPHWDRLWAHPSRTLLAASGRAVGLPAGQILVRAPRLRACCRRDRRQSCRRR